jgi:hypothetical protein
MGRRPEDRWCGRRTRRKDHPVIDPFAIQDAKDPCWIGDERISIGATLPARWQLLRKPTDSLLKQRRVGVLGDVQVKQGRRGPPHLRRSQRF